MLWCYMFCNFRENITNQFNVINHAINGCDWYLFPHEVQRILPTIMVSTQRPLILRGFVNVVCTREAFKNVCVTRTSMGNVKFPKWIIQEISWNYSFLNWKEIERLSLIFNSISGRKWRILVFYVTATDWIMQQKV